MDSDLDGTSNTISKTLEPTTNYLPEQKVDEHFHDKQEEDATDRLSKQENGKEFNVKDTSMQIKVNLNNSSQEKILQDGTLLDIKQENWVSEEETTTNQPNNSKLKEFDDTEDSVDVNHNSVSNINQDTESETTTDHFSNPEDNKFTTMLRKEDFKECDISADLKHFNNPGIHKSKSLKELKHEDIQEDSILHAKQDIGGDKAKPTDNFNSHENHQSKSLTNFKNEADIKEDLIQFSDEESNQSESSTVLKIEDIYKTYLMQLDFKQDTKQENVDIKNENKEGCSQENKYSTPPEIEEIENCEDLLQLDLKRDIKQANVDTKNENEEEETHENTSSTGSKIGKIENKEDLTQLGFTQDLKEENAEKENHENKSSTDLKQDLAQLVFNHSDESDDSLCSKTSSAHEDLHTCTIDDDNNRPMTNEQSSSSQQTWFENVIQTQKDLYEAKRTRMMRTFEIKMQLMDLKKQFLIQKLKYAKEEQELKMMLEAAIRKKDEAEKELAQRKKE